MFRSQRGSTLILTMVVVLTVAAIGVALIRFASREVAGSTAARKAQQLSACAEAGRQLLVSQFKTVGTPVTDIAALSNVALDATTVVSGGHYDGLQNVQVSRLPGWSAGPPRPSRIGWRVATADPGGWPYKVVVRCQVGGTGAASSGRQLEIEYGVRFGL